MLRFQVNVGRYHQLQFLSNRDPVKSCSKIGRSIVLLQADKTGVVHKRGRILPRLRVRRIFIIHFFVT
jgi:hypothetical protein